MTFPYGAEVLRSNVVKNEVREVARLSMKPYLVRHSANVENDAFLDRKPAQ